MLESSSSRLAHWKVLCCWRLESSNRCFVFMWLPGLLLIPPPVSDIMTAPPTSVYSSAYAERRSYTTSHLPSSHSNTDLNTHRRERLQVAKKHRDYMCNVIEEPAHCTLCWLSVSLKWIFHTSICFEPLFVACQTSKVSKLHMWDMCCKLLL